MAGSDVGTPGGLADAADAGAHSDDNRPGDLDAESEPVGRQSLLPDRASAFGRGFGGRKAPTANAGNGGRWVPAAWASSRW